jgi:hypothetical protein
MSHRFGLATQTAPGHDEGKVSQYKASQYPGKLEKNGSGEARCHGVGCIG